MEGPSDERLNFGMMGFGCKHYRRRCKIRAPCCNEIYDCRHCHNEAKKQTKLVQDENQLLENILRTLLQELASAAVQAGEKIMQYGESIADGEIGLGQIPCLLDIVLYLCEKEHVEGGMIFQLLEDLTEMSTMRNCEDVFGYIESKKDIGEARIICTRKTCDVEDMQSTSASSVKGK